LWVAGLPHYGKTRDSTPHNLGAIATPPSRGASSLPRRTWTSIVHIRNLVHGVYHKRTGSIESHGLRGVLLVTVKCQRNETSRVLAALPAMGGRSGNLNRTMPCLAACFSVCFLDGGVPMADGEARIVHVAFRRHRPVEFSQQRRSAMGAERRASWLVTPPGRICIRHHQVALGMCGRAEVPQLFRRAEIGAGRQMVRVLFVESPVKIT